MVKLVVSCSFIVMLYVSSVKTHSFFSSYFHEDFFVWVITTKMTKPGGRKRKKKESEVGEKDRNRKNTEILL